MRERVCENCGGRSYKIVGQNMVKCRFCGTLYVDEHASKEEEVLLVGAYKKLREGEFAQAIEEFSQILTIYPMSFEAYYGRVLAKNKIVFYTNKRGFSKNPRFFGDKITSITDDEDFKKAIENAPLEVAKTYNEQVKRIEKIYKNAEDVKSQKCDVIIVSSGYDKKNPDEKLDNLIKELSKQSFDIYFLQGLDGREKEEETFQALQTAKVLVVYIKDDKNLLEQEIKNVYDRYLYKIYQKEKTRSSLFVAYDSLEVSIDKLPKELLTSRNILDINAEDFLQELQTKIKKEISMAIKETAKIETVKIDKVEPIKKEYIDVSSVNPSELGHYHVDNVELSTENKIKWIFLSLKHGDFQTAKELLEQELSKDPNNSELLFAQLMLEQSIKTQEEFFANIGNFKNRENIDNILKFASKEFAEYFVDSWENLIINLDSEEYYNYYILYLAKYNSPNHDKFVESAENKAIETLNEELIDKVLKCFSQNDVERFVDFYFKLAQQSDNQEYYEKVLSIDEGHEQSNMAVLLQHFKTNEEKLTYRNKDEIESVFKFLSENTRVQFVSIVVNMILSICFIDIDKAEKQLDFYLSYISDEVQLTNLLKNIALKFQQMGFFKQAEKYLSIAISKNKGQSELYWLLIQIKTHCKNDKELIMSNVKITQMPEWETLLTISDEEQTEKYAEIVSKVNLYSGERISFKDDNLDISQLKEKLHDFLNRNEKILLEFEKQEGLSCLSGINYYRLQLKPFEEYLKNLDTIETTEQYDELFKRIKFRLENLDLTLDSSINVVNLTNKEDGLKNLRQDEQKKEEKREERYKKIKNTRSLKKYMFIFLELFPLIFTTLLLTVAMVVPKEVYMYFSQEFLVMMVLISMFIGIINLVLFVMLKNKSTKTWKVGYVTLFALSIVNLILLCSGFYAFPKEIHINNSKEFSVLMNNAGYSTLILDNDIDLNGKKWESVDFNGIFDGQGHEIKNLKFADKKQIGLFGRNSGEIKNLTINLKESSYKNCQYFGGIASVNTGTITNCNIVGIVTFSLDEEAIIGGIVGEFAGGEIENCKIDITFVVNTSKNNENIGGVAGKVTSSKNSTKIRKNEISFKTNVCANDSNILYIGGVSGFVENLSSFVLEQNAITVDVEASGRVENATFGGIIGQSGSFSKNNYSVGKIDVSQLEGSCLVGGLYGKYENSDLSEKISTSYSTIEIIQNSTCKAGGLVGVLGGVIENCFSNSSINLIGQTTSSWAQAKNCLNLTDQYYDSSLKFEQEIWNISDGNYPILK